jgi:hypothetical protein
MIIIICPPRGRPECPRIIVALIPKEQPSRLDKRLGVPRPSRILIENPQAQGDEIGLDPLVFSVAVAGVAPVWRDGRLQTMGEHLPRTNPETTVLPYRVSPIPLGIKRKKGNNA